MALIVIDVFISPGGIWSSSVRMWPTSDLLTEDYNVFGGGWTWVPHHMGSHSIYDETPDFIKTSSSAAQDFSQGDWRLKSTVSQAGATYSAGITWKLKGRLFGIAAWDGGELEPGGDLPPPPSTPPGTNPPPSTPPRGQRPVHR